MRHHHRLDARGRARDRDPRASARLEITTAICARAARRDGFDQRLQVRAAARDQNTEPTWGSSARRPSIGQGRPPAPRWHAPCDRHCCQGGTHGARERCPLSVLSLDASAAAPSRSADSSNPRDYRAFLAILATALYGYPSALICLRPSATPMAPRRGSRRTRTALALIAWVSRPTWQPSRRARP